MNLPETLTNAQSWTLIGPLGPLLPAFLSQHPQLAVDGGAKYSTRIDLWVGDQDSFIGEPQGPHIMKLSTDKDSSDLASALKILDQVKTTHFSLWGFLGGRKDHELFNLGECLHFLNSRSGNNIDIYDAKGEIHFKLFAKGKWDITCHGLFSLGCMTPALVTLTGECLYPINHPTTLAPFSSFGLSNRGSGILSLTTNAPVFMIFPEEA